jgi:hypothetical protein
MSRSVADAERSTWVYVVRTGLTVHRTRRCGRPIAREQRRYLGQALRRETPRSFLGDGAMTGDCRALEINDFDEAHQLGVGPPSVGRQRVGVGTGERFRSGCL